MTTFSNPDNLWDMSLPPSLPSLADDEFLALLQKQFDTNNDHLNKQQPVNIPQTTNIDPASLRTFPHETSPSPPLSDDSPSPPSARDLSRSRRESGAFGDANSSQQAADDDNLKRKADEEEDDEDFDGKASHGTVLHLFPSDPSPDLRYDLKARRIHLLGAKSLEILPQ